MSKPGKDRPDKLPYNPRTGQTAQCNNPDTFASFTDALITFNGGKAGYSGIGVGLFGNLAAVDIDGCINPAMKQISDLALDVVSTMKTYTEISPSGTGLRLFFFAPDYQYNKSRYYIKNSKAGLEVYVAGHTHRFVTVTGNVYGFPLPITDCSATLPLVLEKHMLRGKSTEIFDPAAELPEARSFLTDEQVVEKIHKEKDQKFAVLYDSIPYSSKEDRDALAQSVGLPSGSEADQSLCNKLAFYCGRDMEQMDRIFKQSGLMSNKWERDDYSTRTLKNAVCNCHAIYGTSATADFGGLPLADGQSVKPSDFTDAGNAAVYASMFQGAAAYCISTGWLVWDGARWEESELAAQILAIRLTNTMLAEAKAQLCACRAELTEAEAAVDTDRANKAMQKVAQAKAYLKHALSTRDKSKIQAMMTLARPFLEVKSDALDADPYTLNTPAGMVDLRSGGVMPHDPSKFCTKITAASPSDVGADLWAALVDTVTERDAELAAFNQYAAGMAAVGKVFMENLIIALGDGANGKSTFYNPQIIVLGDYAGMIDADLLTTVKQNKGAELATLRGKRLVIAAELEEGRRLSTGALKRITSTDRVRAERKYLAPEDFIPSHTVVLYTNHAPRVGSTDAGTWRRLAVVPFTAKIPKQDEVKNYADTLVREAGGAILSWIIEGAVAFCRAGHTLPHCSRVDAAKGQYKKDNDWMSLFLEECCDVGEGKSVMSGVLYKRYREWAMETGNYIRSMTDFTAELEKREFVKHKNNRGHTWTGLGFTIAAVSPFPTTVCG
jgi:P4 family phage/plasmid primase-like protien